MKSFASVLLGASFASAEAYSLSKGNCNRHSLLDSKQCSNLAAEMGISYKGGTDREGFYFPRGCYLYNEAHDPTRPGQELAFYYNTKPKQGPCTKTRTCYCDNKQKRSKDQEFTNDLIMLNHGNCDEGTKLNSQECRTVSMTMDHDMDSFAGTTCKKPDCAPSGCYLYNGRWEHHISEVKFFNDIGYSFNDYKTGKCTDIRQCVCHRRSSSDHGGYGGYGDNDVKKDSGYGDSDYGGHGYGDSDYGDGTEAEYGTNYGTEAEYGTNYGTEAEYGTDYGTDSYGTEAKYGTNYGTEAEYGTDYGTEAEYGTNYGTEAEHGYGDSDYGDYKRR